jgi:hypothetical protein
VLKTEKEAVFIDRDISLTHSQKATNTEKNISEIGK